MKKNEKINPEFGKKIQVIVNALEGGNLLRVQEEFTKMIQEYLIKNKSKLTNHEADFLSSCSKLLQAHEIKIEPGEKNAIKNLENTRNKFEAIGEMAEHGLSTFVKAIGTVAKAICHLCGKIIEKMGQGIQYITATQRVIKENPQMLAIVNKTIETLNLGGKEANKER